MSYLWRYKRRGKTRKGKEGEGEEAAGIGRGGEGRAGQSVREIASVQLEEEEEEG